MTKLRDVYASGVGTSSFGKHLDRSLGDLAADAWNKAAKDAGIVADDVDYVIFSNAANGVMTGQEMIRGQVALKGTGLAGKPLVNTENACASGGSATHLAWLTVASGVADVAVAIGAEKLFHQDKARSFAAIESGTDRSLSLAEPGASGSVMMNAYATEARDYAKRYGDVDQALAQIAVKNRRHASDNPDAQFQQLITADDVLASRSVAPPLRLLMCSPLTDGAAAVVFTASSPSDATRRVRVLASELGSYRDGAAVVRDVAHKAYASSGIGALDLDVVQVHDACAYAELVQMEELGLVRPGEAIEAVLAGESAVGGAFPINTDGGLLSRGHALGATGLAQIAELVVQLRGTASARQVERARRAMSVSAGGWMGHDYAAAAVTMLALE